MSVHPHAPLRHPENDWVEGLAFLAVFFIAFVIVAGIFALLMIIAL